MLECPHRAGQHVRHPGGDVLEPPGPVRLPQPVAGIRLEGVEQQPDRLALVPDPHAVEDALARQAAHAPHARHHEDRVDREQEAEAERDRLPGPGQPDEAADDDRDREQVRDRQERADHVGVRDQAGHDGDDEQPRVAAGGGEQHDRQGRPGEAQGEGQAGGDPAAPPDGGGRGGVAVGAPVEPGRVGRRRDQHRDHGEQAEEVGVRGRAPEEVRDGQRDDQVRHRRVGGELQRLVEEPRAHLQAVAVRQRVVGVGTAEAAEQRCRAARPGSPPRGRLDRAGRAGRARGHVRRHGRPRGGARPSSSGRPWAAASRGTAPPASRPSPAGGGRRAAASPG